MTIVSSSLIQSLPDTTQLALYLSRKSIDSEILAKIEDLLQLEPDWDDFLEVSNQHKINYFVYEGIKSSGIDCPEFVVDSLKKKLALSSRKMLAYMAETASIVKQLEENSVKVILYKGASLAQELYGEVGARQSRDIDMLIEAENMEFVDELIHKSGYKRNAPKGILNKQQYKVYKKHYYQFIYSHPEKKIVLEIHWKLSRYKTLYPNLVEKLSYPLRTIKTGGADLTTLSREDYVSYLLLHGTLHNWFRLFWLRDIAEVIYRWNDIDWKSLYERLRNANMQRVMLSGLYLAHSLYGADIPEGLENLPTDSRSIRLISRSLRMISDSSEKKTTHNIYQSRYSLLDIRHDFLHRWTVLLSSLTSNADWQLLPLPESLFFLYYPLRPFLWLYRFMKK